MRKLLCEYGPLAYWISTQKCRWARRVKDLISLRNVARHKSADPLPEIVMKYETILFRDSEKFNPVTEQNKKINVTLAYPKLSNIVINQGETFSFWKLLGKCTAKKGYKEARMLIHNKPAVSVGGGLCQIPNLIHFLALHSMLTVTERHNHDWADLYPDFGKQIPFGTGTSVLYNYRDLRLKNNTELTYQIILTVKDNHLCGELRSDRPQDKKFRIDTAGFCFTREGNDVYRNGKAVRHLVNENDEIISSEALTSYHAKVLYDSSELVIKDRKDFHETAA
ncbi:MAG: VanW family protein [Chitinispirillales bacterium]|jgi:vancomycin resistance protein VanW|nr:VanW family protein [Chitinispirillales bacterium]